jgi:hypothetical protein
MTSTARAHYRRIFEEALTRAQVTYAPTKDVMVEATIPNAAGQPEVVARYKLSVDGRVECFEVLDAVLWPPCAPATPEED